MDFVISACIAVVLTASGLIGIVNPSLQPIHLLDRYRVVVGGEVVTVDQRNRTFTMSVSAVVKGAFPAKEVVVDASADAAAEGFAHVRAGQVIVVFLGKIRRGHERSLMLYSGSGKWGTGTMDAADAGRWIWDGDPDRTGEEGKGDATMWGTFSGRGDRLLEMLRDQVAGTAFFPPVPIISFDNDLQVGKLAQPVSGVALYDLDGDERCDVVATSAAGVQVWLQRQAMTFADATAGLGLSDARAVSVSCADADGDGRADLLLDGGLWLQGAAGRFARSVRLPAQADQWVLSAAFVEVDGDGWPDVLISRRGGGLSLWLNKGPEAGPFTDATRLAGLDRPECGAASTGYFAPAPPDWDEGAKAGLWYATRGGLLLKQDDHGVFSPARVDLRLPADRPVFDQADSTVPGLTGAGVFAPMWRQDRPTLFVPLDNDFRTAFWERGALVEASQWANELSERTYFQSFSLAEDLDMDGYVDTWTGSRSPTMQNTCHINRGYGSWMRAEKYKRSDQGDAFNSEAHLKGAGGAAVGDVNGDGANDLLIGSLDGTVSLLVSDVLAGRKEDSVPTYHQRKLLETGILSVRISGRKGVIGATVMVSGADGKILGRRDIAGNVATGCRGPDTVNFAVRETGPVTVSVRFGDGAVATTAAGLGPLQHVRLTVDRAQAKP